MSLKNPTSEGDTTRNNLIEIISKYSQIILEDPKKLKNLLLDLNRGVEKKEVNIICSSLDEMIPFDLLKSKDYLPYDIMAEQSMRRLQNSYGVTEDLARWTVDTWAISLHVITEKSNIQLIHKPATVSVPYPQHQTGTTQSVSRPLAELNNISKELYQNRVNNKSTKTGYYALGLFILSILLMSSGNMFLGGLGVFALMASMVLAIYFIGKNTNLQVYKPQSISRPTITPSKNQITGKYEKNKFVLMLAGICFAIPFILIELFPNAKVQATGLFDQMIAWSIVFWIPMSFALLAAYGGYIFTLKK